MKQETKWVIIPDCARLSESAALAEEYDAAFEYNDFFLPAVYQDPNETKRRVKLYQGLSRDRSMDTLHGVFLDIAIASQDDVIRTYSRNQIQASMRLAQQLGLRGAVFHTGMIAQLNYGGYQKAWLDAAEEVFRPLAAAFPDVNIYIENTFEQTPEVFVLLMQRMADVKNVSLCLDYAHAVLTKTPCEKWVEMLAPKIGHIHLNDNDLSHDLHQCPGDGTMDFAEFRALTARYSVTAPILLELFGIEKQKKALDFMKDIIDRNEEKKGEAIR